LNSDNTGVDSSMATSDLVGWCYSPKHSPYRNRFELSPH